MEAYSINIVGLSNKVHHFSFDIDDAFFGRYGTDLIEKGSFKADVTLDKHETFINVNFNISGSATLICDRSLEPFEYPIKTNKMVVFKYGEEDQEISDEILIINRETVSLELGQFMYEFLGLAVPMKKLHPKFQDEDEYGDEEGKIIYSSSTEKGDDDQDDNAIDPRWEKLKKLK